MCGDHNPLTTNIFRHQTIAGTVLLALIEDRQYGSPE